MGQEGRVLEPSPPANLDPDWYADDPTQPEGAPVVTPIPGEGTTWADLARGDEQVARFAHDHWLDGQRRLTDLPARYDQGRKSLHQLAYFVLAPRRFHTNGKLGLRFTQDGFGTPFFRGEGDADVQVRVEGGELVVQSDDTVRAEPISTVEAACELVDVRYQERWYEFRHYLEPFDPKSQLAIDDEVTAAISAWFGFATHVLERLRRTTTAEEVSRVQIWPENFDAAAELGSQERGRRASYGASPGDAQHPEPYLYVSAHGEIDRSDLFWNDRAFNGASLPYAELLRADDPYQTALAFWELGHRKLMDKASA